MSQQNPDHPIRAIGVPPIYRDSLNRIVETWPGNPPKYLVEEGSRDAYNHMRNVLRIRLARTARLTTAVNSTAHAAGSQIISNFFYAGAAKASELGYSVEELGAALYQRSSFMQLTAFMREENDDARALEADLGLTDYSLPPLNEYTLTPNGLTFPMLAIARYRHFSEKADFYGGDLENFAPVNEGEVLCPAFHNGMYTYLYRGILKICMSDPALFTATLETHAPQTTSVIPMNVTA